MKSNQRGKQERERQTTNKILEFESAIEDILSIARRNPEINLGDLTSEVVRKCEGIADYLTGRQSYLVEWIKAYGTYKEQLFGGLDYVAHNFDPKYFDRKAM